MIVKNKDLKKNFRAEASTIQIQVQHCLQQFAKAAKHIINKYKKISDGKKIFFLCF